MSIFAQILKKECDQNALLTSIEQKLCDLVASQKQYLVLCDEEQTPFLKCVDPLTGECSILTLSGDATGTTCETVTRTCTTVACNETIFAATLTQAVIAGTTTDAPANWATLTLQQRCDWFAALIPATHTWDQSTGRLCGADAGTGALSIVIRYGRLGRLFAWAITTFTECTSTAPVGELAPCIGGVEYDVEVTTLCSDVHGNIDKVTVFEDGVPVTETYVVVETGEQVTDLGVITPGYCDASTEKLCDLSDNMAIQLDCLCNDACSEPLVEPLVKANNTFTVAADSTETYAVGSTVAFYDASGNPLGTATVSGAATTNANGDLVYPVTDCTVDPANEAEVTSVKSVIKLAAEAVKNVAVKFSKTAIKVKEPTKEVIDRDINVATRSQ